MAVKPTILTSMKPPHDPEAEKEEQPNDRVFTIRNDRLHRSRVLTDNTTVFVGTGLPIIASIHAQLTHAPGLGMIFEAGPRPRSRDGYAALRWRHSSLPQGVLPEGTLIGLRTDPNEGTRISRSSGRPDRHVTAT